jgi:hypothetical protein
LAGFEVIIDEVMKNLHDLHVADGMLMLTQCLGDCPRIFANPSQRRLRVSTRLLINQPFQCLHQTRIGLSDGFAARSGRRIRPTNGLPLPWSYW